MVGEQFQEIKESASKPEDSRVPRRGNSHLFVEYFTAGPPGPAPASV